MQDIKQGTTKDEFKKSLNKIGWDIKGYYLNERIVDHKKKIKTISVRNDRLEIDGDKFSCCFYFSNVELYELEDRGNIDCVGLKANENVFIQFYNHDKNQSIN